MSRPDQSRWPEKRCPRWLDWLLCFIGSHDWRDGPGTDCTSCGKHDDFFERTR